MAKHRVAQLGELSLESLQRVEVEGTPICLARVADGNVYAIGDVCTHEEYSLSEGELWDLAVECPVHGSRFDLRTGRVAGPPAVIPARTFPVTVEEGEIYVEV